MITEIRIELLTTEYPIYVGSNIFHLMEKIISDKKVLIISNPLVFDMHGSKVIDSLNNCDVNVFLIPEGEVYKNIDTACNIYAHMINGEFDRHCFIVALGGGVVGDIAGFVAATYMRGVKYVQVPTTLLAQVDSSIGGKVAVNHLSAKNVIGSFYHPAGVYSDLETLSTLPDEEFRNGMAEVIKYALIYDEELFRFLSENDIESIRNNDSLVYLISRCAQIKATVVGKDEKEEGLRMILNYGHTAGHAFESASGYTLKHGFAVALGMVTAAKVSVKLGLLKIGDEKKIKDIIQKYGLPISITGLEVERICNLIKHDKKALNGRIRFVLIESIGKVSLHSDVPAEVLLESLNEVILYEK